MRVFNTYGSKERLFEIMGRVNHIQLNEQSLPIKKREVVINEFVDYVDGKLGFGEEKPNVILSYDDNQARTMKSFGGYTPNEDKIMVVVANRNLADVLRTLAHELVHFKQHKDCRLKPNSGEDGSEEENEANALAGVLLREFGKNNPIIFE